MTLAFQEILVVLRRRAVDYLDGGKLDTRTMTAEEAAKLKKAIGTAEITNDASERVFGILDYLKTQYRNIADVTASTSAMVTCTTRMPQTKS